MGKFRARSKTGKNRQRWKKGQSSSSNPNKTKHRDAAKARLLRVGFGGQLGTSAEPEVPRGFGNGAAKLTAESLLRHDAFMGNADLQTSGDKKIAEDALTLGQTNKTFDSFASSVWSQCSNVSFARLLPRFNPSNPKHKEMLAILSAIGEVIAENSDAQINNEEIPSAKYFGALLTSLDAADTTEGLSATVGLLSIVIKTVDKELLQAKFSPSSKLLLELLSKHGHSEDASVVRGLLGCLSILLRAEDKETWSHKSTMMILDSVLSFVTDGRPKVRKAAHHAVCSILASKDEKDDFHPAAANTAKFLVSQLESTAGGSDIKGVLHILILLKEILYVFPKTQVKAACEAVLKVMTLGNVYTLSCAFQALHGLFAGRPSAKSLPAELNAQLINAMYNFQPSLNDAQPLVAWLTVQQEAHINLAEQDPQLCFDNLPKLFSTVTKCWASDRVEVAGAATTALKAIFYEAVRPNLDFFVGNSSVTGQIKVIFSHIEEGLKYQYHGAWAQVF